MNSSQRGAEASVETVSRRAVVVLGMHRSGTSALAGALGLAGARLPTRLMPATGANPRGYCESQLLYELHEELLAELGATWSDVSAPGASWLTTPGAERWVGRFAKAVEEEFAGKGLFVVKDPRICRLVPLWQRVFDRLGVTAGYVVMVRHPLEVAGSLGREHGLDEGRAVLLWLDHLLRAERDTRSLPRTLVSYERLLGDWRGTLRRIGRDLDLALPRLSRRAQAEIEEFLSGDLRHQRVEPVQLALREDLVRWVRQAYDWAVRAADDAPADTDVLDTIGAEFEVAEQAFGPLLASAELGRLREVEEAAALRDQVADWREQVARHAEGLESLREELARRETAIELLKADVEERRRAHLQVVEWVKAMLRWSTEAAAGQAVPSQSFEAAFAAFEEAAPGELPALATATLKLTTELASALQVAEGRAREVTRLDREAARLRARLAIATERAERGEQELSRLSTLAAEREAEVGRLSAELASSEAAAGGVRAELAASRADAGRLQQEADGIRGELDRARASAQEQLARAREELERARAEVADRILYVERLKERLAEIEGSLTWRASRPARAVARGVAVLLRP
jgi:hypothetical protein